MIGLLLLGAGVSNGSSSDSKIPKPRRPKIPAKIRVPIKMPAKEIAKI